ncbi:Alpha,alpha-trehalose-phosphate synthase [UDP-forming] 1 [Platanthera guangdongensis]|uniref:Alpha,alpha-trehalose-phosphate synthase [UDP-forming] 1 n=1 Tax=Platanthera guangdongensis TaxID=2320717 RepID=A0ABR2M5P9_9ASPA
MKLASGNLHSDHMPVNKYNSRNQNRVDRLLRVRELRKLSRTFNIYDKDAAGGIGSNNASDCSPELDRLVDDEVGGAEYAVEVEDELEASSVAMRILGEGCGAADRKPMKQRLLVVANRLPVSAVRLGEDSWSLDISAGGLVSALLGVRDVDAKWIGWAGVNVPDEVGQRALTKALAEKVRLTLKNFIFLKFLGSISATLQRFSSLLPAEVYSCVP